MASPATIFLPIKNNFTSFDIKIFFAIPKIGCGMTSWELHSGKTQVQNIGCGMTFWAGFFQKLGYKRGRLLRDRHLFF